MHCIAVHIITQIFLLWFMKMYLYFEETVGESNRFISYSAFDDMYWNLLYFFIKSTSGVIKCTSILIKYTLIVIISNQMALINYTWNIWSTVPSHALKAIEVFCYIHIGVKTWKFWLIISSFPHFKLFISSWGS